MPTATITSKGQITIPSEVRKKLGLKAGDQINFFEDEGGKYTFEPKTGSIMDMEGILKHLGLPRLDHAPTSEEMDAAVLEAVSEDYLRSIGESTVATEHAKAS
jgi:AbrB family looped-hinge helix DNA binding protein